MNKSDIIEQVYAVNEKDFKSKAAAERAVNCVFDTIREFTAVYGKVSIDGLGTFEMTRRASHNGVNPQTGEKIKIKAHNTLRFKAAKKFKDRIAKSKFKPEKK